MIVCTFGDLVLDVIAQLERPLVPGDDAPARTAVGPGGQAANVAAWCFDLGAESRLVCKRGGDDAGELVAAELRRRGVDVVGPVATGRTGVVISIAETGVERTMASDRGVGSTLAVDELDAHWFACDALHVSGYSLLEEDMAAAGAYAAGAARANGARVSVDVATWSAIGVLGRDRFRSRIEALEPDLVFGGRRELDELGELDANVEVIRKLGAEGVVLGGRLYEPKRGPVVDSTGAGDALAAGFLVGGIELGLEAAARCVAKLGTMP